MKNSDVIRVYQALTPEFHEFRDEALDSSVFERPIDVINLIEHEPMPQSSNRSTLQDGSCLSPTIEIIPQEVAQSWLCALESWTKEEAPQEFLKKNAFLGSSKCTNRACVFLIGFCDSVRCIGLVVHGLQWILSYSRTNTPRSMTDFLHEIMTSTFHLIVQKANSTIENVIEHFFDRLDFVSTQQIYGTSFAQKIAKLDKFSAATTFTSRLFGAWYKVQSLGEADVPDNVERKRFLAISQRRKNLGSCLRRLLASPLKKYEATTLPEIMLVLNEINSKGGSYSTGNGGYSYGFVGFPSRIIFNTNQEQLSVVSCDDNDALCITVEGREGSSVEYIIHSVGYFDEADTNRFCIALRSNSPDGMYTDGVWSEISYCVAGYTKTRLVCREALKKTSLVYACYTKISCKQKDEATYREGLILQTDSVSHKCPTSLNADNEPKIVPAPSLPLERKPVSIPAGNISIVERPKRSGAPRSLISKERIRQAKALPAEMTLGEPLHDEEWNEALDKGRSKKQSRKKEFPPHDNPFQRISNRRS